MGAMVIHFPSYVRIIVRLPIIYELSLSPEGNDCWWDQVLAIGVEGLMPLRVLALQNQSTWQRAI